MTTNSVTQASLWGQEPTYHQIIEVRYQGGREEVYCCEKPYRPSGPGQIYAGYVGFPIPAKDCPICAGNGNIDQLRAGTVAGEEEEEL